MCRLTLNSYVWRATSFSLGKLTSLINVQVKKEICPTSKSISNHIDFYAEIFYPCHGGRDAQISFFWSILPHKHETDILMFAFSPPPATFSFTFVLYQEYFVNWTITLVWMERVTNLLYENFWEVPRNADRHGIESVCICHHHSSKIAVCIS